MQSLMSPDNRIEPWGEVDRWLDRTPVFDQRPFLPAVDIYQDATSVHVRAELPGFRPNQIRLTIEGSMLTITGECKRTSEVEEKTYHRREIRVGSFTRAVELPPNIDADNVIARHEDGVLHVVIPKRSGAPPKHIPIINSSE